MKKLALITLLVAATATSAFAGEGYFVASVGQSDADISKSSIDQALSSAGVTGISSTLSKTDTAYKLQLGYQFNKNFALEGGYVDLGKANYSTTFTGGSAKAEAKSAGINIAAVGILPVNESFSVFGKLGVIYAKVDVAASATGTTSTAFTSANSTDFKPNVGVGASYQINKDVGVRAEYERFGKIGKSSVTGEADVDLFSAGVVVKF